MVALANLAADLSPGTWRTDSGRHTHDIHIAIRHALGTDIFAAASDRGRIMCNAAWSAVRLFPAAVQVGVEGCGIALGPFIYGPVV